ncbi:MAG: hypothetical protein JL50_08085 [Peptococcaceae bacterium BICA1-7]|nr:MAG: hypothetical protein JL50_08085 [Peptococcaceae bacterium BICA1-7]HBV97482.1 tripartite tricarboxylate transporter TctB family protein [Desulfotomaculum sp.]
MLNSTSISSFAFLIIAAAAWYMTGDLSKMGSFFPRVIAVMMGIFAIIQIAVSLLQKKKEEPFSGIDAKRVISMVLGISLYVALIMLIGFILSGILFLAFFFWYLERGGDKSPSMARSLILAVLITGAFYSVFHYIFLVPLPVGMLFGG